MKKYLKLMRVQHYIKNILIFLPLVFSGQLLNILYLKKSLLGFFAFSFAASAIYIVNDIKDVENDRKHAVKCKRPIASGEVTIKSAWILMSILIVLAIILNYLAADVSPYSWVLLLSYVIINIFYSLGLKNIPIIDIGILALGFLIRVFYGSSIVNIEISNWLYLTIISISFYFGFGKRRNEILRQGDFSRKVLKYYNYNFLDKNMYLCLALTITFYALWCVDPNTILKMSSHKIIWTVPFVMFICMKYSLDVESGSYGDPVDVLLSDKVLIIMTILYAIIMIMTIYFNHITILIYNIM